MTLLLIYIIAVVSVSFLCSLMESILLSLNFSYIQVLKRERPVAGEMLEKLKKDIGVPLSAILIVNTIANTIGAAGVGAQSASLLGMEYMFYVSAALTLLILFLSEIIPKTIGAIYWKELAPMAAYILRVLIFVSYPLVKVAMFVTKKISGKHKGHMMTREELLESALMGEDAGIIDEKESDIIENTLQLSKSKIYDILTPRSVVFAVDKSMSVRDVLLKEEVHKFSRIPVYDGSIDHIVGMVMAKKIFQKAIINQDVAIESIMQPIFSIHENIPVSYALDMFIKRREHMFLVTDSYDQTEGIVTLEDCIETVLGVEIMDEADTTDDMQAFAKRLMKIKKKQQKKAEKKAEKDQPLLENLQDYPQLT
jgi:CBS domain containing-hemolysin-like protein